MTLSQALDLDPRMKVAIVGIGYWGSKLLRNLIDLVGVRKVIAVDGHLDRLASVGQQYPGLQIEYSLVRALEDPTIRAVVIATPAETHTALALLALQQQRHVFVEKPLASSVSEASNLVETAARRDLVLMVGHTFLFSPRVRWIADYLASGQMGRVHYVTSSRLNLGGHNSVTNVVWDLCPHDFSIVFELLREFPSRVQAIARSLVRPDLPDVAFVNLEFPSGTIASVDVSWLAPKKIRNTVIVGDTSMIVYDDNDPEEPVKVYDKGVELPEADSSFSTNRLTYRYGNTVAPYIPVTEPLRDELEVFLDASLRNDPVVRSDGHFGLQVVRALEAADQSWRRGGEPIIVEYAQPSTPLARATRLPVSTASVPTAPISAGTATAR